MKIKFLKDHRIISRLASTPYSKGEILDVDEAHGAALVKAGWVAEVQAEKTQVRAEAQSAQSPSPAPKA